MLTNIIPATAFTVATTGPAVLSWLPLMLVTVLATVAVVLLVAWAFRREARQQRAAGVVTTTPAPLVVSVIPARGER